MLPSGSQHDPNVTPVIASVSQHGPNFTLAFPSVSHVSVFLRLEVEGGTVDAVSQASRLRSIRKDMAQVRVTLKERGEKKKKTVITVLTGARLPCRKS